MATHVFPELRSLIAKTAGVVDVIRRDVESIETSVDLAFVFGSIAKGEERGTSDIDLFVIGRAGFGEVVDAFAESQRLHLLRRRWRRRPAGSPG